MEAFSMSSLAICSEEVKDFVCFSCKEQADADFYCKTCLKLYCGKCIVLHDKWFEKHSAYGRNDMNKWPVPKQVEEFLLKCEAHNEEKIEMLCDYHSQLCCTKCAFLYHSHCRKVNPISKLINTHSTNLQGLSVKLETVLGEIKSLQSSQEARFQSTEGTYTEHVAFMIEQMRANINNTINECGKRSLKRSDEKEQHIKEQMCRSVRSILNEFDKSSVKELKEVKDEVISIQCSISNSINKCTGLQNKLTQMNECIQKIGDNKEFCLIASIKCERELQQASSVLGKLGKVFTVRGKSMHNLRISSDSETCRISGCCVLPDGQVLVADNRNKKVKLLNQQYQVLSHCAVTARSQDICLITPSEVAVSVYDRGNTPEVQFITVTQSQLVLGRTFQLQHASYGIAHHHGDLFINSGTELFKYSLNGKLVCKMYEDVSGDYTVYKCAVSPTGDKLYITNRYRNTLLTLARDGTVMAVFTDPDLQGPYGVYVTPAGQVLVCGWLPNTIVQVDSGGRNKLATLNIGERYGMWSPWSVCYSSTTSSIIVGQERDNILVFRVE